MRRQPRRAGTPHPKPRWRYDPAPQLLGPRIARFRDPRHGDGPWPPFPALLREPVPIGPLPPEFPIRPRFSSHRRQIIAEIGTVPGTSLYGTGEVVGPLLRNGRRTTLRTTDAFDYTIRSRSLYQAHPWVLAVRPNGTAFGVMAQTTWPSEIDLREGIVFRTDGPAPSVIIIDRDSPQDVLIALAELTGTMPMPPRWALGYHQCRWSYEPQSRVKEVAAQFRRRGIPCDCLWLDIDYMNGFRCFTFDKTKFPDPAKLTADLRAQGFKTTAMIDPGIKAERGYKVYDSGREGGHFIRNSTGDEYHGEVWPGACAFPDYTRARTRAWWADLYRDFLKVGIDGIWNDMNEPAVFDQPGKAMPADCRHDADEDLGGPGPHTRYRNLYGMQMVRATREGVEKANPDRRPFVLTRSNFLGGHRYAATWTGDNRSDWTHLAWSIPMILNLGLSGQPFSGPDIGGFVGDATPALFARWMGIGALLPFARGHSIKDSKDHEPWAFGVDCENTCRAALERRYRLLPYLYTVFHEAHRTGLPVVRPLFFADPSDPRLRACDDAFLIGADFAVFCNISPNHRSGPADQSLLSGWKRFEVFGLWAHNPADLPALYARPGSIIPLGPIVQYIDESPVDPLTLLVALNEQGTASGMFYEDAGDGHAFRNGEFRLTTFTAQRRNGQTRIDEAEVRGSMPAPTRKVEIVEI